MYYGVLAPVCSDYDVVLYSCDTKVVFLDSPQRGSVLGIYLDHSLCYSR